MNNSAVQIIDTLSKKLEVPTKYLMDTIPQLGITLISDIVICGIVLIISIFTVKWAYKKTKDGRFFDMEFITVFSGIAGSILALFSAISLMVSLSDLVLWLYSPNAWALKYILDKLN